MAIDTAVLSRVQFALTVSFHILFPAFSIGMATFLAIMEGLYLKTKKPHFLAICKFWTKIFALTFGMGVVSGVVMEFQFGTNWNGFTYQVGGVLGSLFVYEVLTAFFIEAGFLGVMLFGWNKVGPKLHYFSTLLVFVGVTLSAFWIMSANSWMQTPDGVVFKDGQFVVTNWWHVIFNPSVIPRYLHMLFAAWITTGFVILSVSAYYLRKNIHVDFAKKSFGYVLSGLLVLVLLQGFIGDAVGLEIHKHQPMKTAAMEGVWETQKGAPFLLFAIPDPETQQNYWALKIPHMAAVLNTHQWNGKLEGLRSVPKAEQPFVPLPFYAFRVMVFAEGLMVFVVFLGAFLWWRKKLFTSRLYHTICLLCAPIGFIALWCGWITAETGRQPWVVYNYLRTVKAASDVATNHVIISLGLIIVVYGIIFGYFYFKYLIKVIKAGPANEAVETHKPFKYMGN